MSNNFTLVPLETLARITMGQSPSSSSVQDGVEKGAPFLQGNAEFGREYPLPKYSCTNPPRVADKGAILISVRAPVGETNISDRSYCIGRGVAAVHFHCYEKRLGRNILEYSAATLKRISQGTTFDAIGRHELSKLLVPKIPTDEAARLESVFANLETQIQNTEELIAKTETLKKGLLHDLLTRGIDKHGKLRPAPDEAPALYKESPLGPVPKDWEVQTLSQVAKQIVDGTHFTPTYVEHGIPFLRVTNIQPGDIETSDFKFISKTEHKALSSRCAPRKGDILMSKNGTVGIAREITWDWEFSIFVSLALIKIRDSKKLFPSYLEHVLNSPLVGRQIRLQSKQGTVTNLHLEEIRKFIVPVPTAVEQVAIKDKIDAYNKFIKLEQDSLSNLRALKTGLMDDLLTGRVRVTPLMKSAKPESV